MSASGAIEGDIEFNTDLFERSSIERLSARMAVLTSALAEAAATTDVWSLQLMPEAEEEQVLRIFNDTAAEYPREVCIHDLVGAQVARSPEAAAVEWRGATLTYAELWVASGQVAAWLRAHGVVTDRVVRGGATRTSD